ncbi:TetR/AcrR family transcriptional regulator [Alkaliphilus oremlandii]|nr:TetR/AcrR family transcriptional regulator [Alkaliphilus oremlandii]
MTINDRLVINFNGGIMARYTSLDPNKYILIRQAAIDLFYKQGINNTNMQEIAKEAGIAKGTIYLYYSSREDLIDHIFNYSLSLHIEASMKDVEIQSSNSEKLKKRVKNILFWNHEYPKEASIVSAYYKPVNIVGTDDVSLKESYEINKVFLQEGIEQKEFKELPLEFLCKMFFSSVEGISTYIRKHPSVLEDEKLLEAMVETTVAGLRKVK